MRKRHIFLAIGLLSLTMLSGCDLIGQWLGLTATVTGSVSGQYWSFQSAATIKVTDGSKTFSHSFTISGGNSQTGTFSIPNVPKGSYKVTVTLKETWSTTPGLGYPKITVNGGSPITGSFALTGSGPYTLTISASNLSIQGDSTITIDMGNMG